MPLSPPLQKDESSLSKAVTADNSLALRIFPCLLDIGEALLLCGADVHLVEDELARIGHAYGAYKMNVFVITEAIVATMTLPNGIEHTFTRRIIGDSSNDFYRIEKLYRLCAQAEKEHLEPAELHNRLSKITNESMPGWALFVGGVLSAGGFTVFFGGTLLDALVSAAFAVVLCISIRYARPWVPNTIIFNFVNSFLCGFAIMGVATFWGNVSTDAVMMGDIMLLIPGVAMTNATRDMLSGDTISGVMRFVESALWAISLALGFMAAIWIAIRVW